MGRHLTYANIMATLALFVALGGTGYAAATINGKHIKNRSIPGKKLKKHTVTGTEIDLSKLGTVQSAANADNAAELGGASASHYVTSSQLATTMTPIPFTDASLLNGWTSFGSTYSKPGYMKDQLGVVHLRGELNGSSSTSVTVFMLPAGYSPSVEKDFAVPCGSGTRVLTVTESTVGTTCTSTVSLEGITFRTDG